MNKTANKTMHILHFMNIPFNVEQFMSGGDNITFGGGWMATLISQMLQKTDFSFSCASLGKTSRIIRLSNNRVSSIVIPQKKGLNGCIQIVKKLNPDLIHIHGTEGPYGLISAKKIINTPTVISLQGLLGPCSQLCNFFGSVNIIKIMKMHRFLEIPAFRGLWITFLKYKINARRERKIILGNNFFIGRTGWDRAYIKKLKSNAEYFYGGELLRKAFWKKQWDINKIKPHRIIFTNAGRPYKGTEILLEAANTIRDEYPDMELLIAGNISKRSGYGLYLRKQIKQSKVNVRILGQLTAQELTQKMLSCHLFISPSLIDNSPNAVCEAQLLGMPVIASYTGGLPSLIEDGKTGLFFTKGDGFVLAEKIRQVFENNDLAVTLGDQAHTVARQRHDPLTIVKDIVTSYNTILGIWHEKN